MREALRWVRPRACAPAVAAALALVCCLGPSHADITVVSPRGMTLDEAVQFALENHPALATVEQGVRVQETGLMQAWAMDDLTIDASLNLTARGPVTSISMPNPQTGETESFQIGSPFTRNLNVSVAAPGTRQPGRRPGEGRGSIHAAAERQVEDARRSVALGAQAFYNVLRTEHLRLIGLDSVARAGCAPADHRGQVQRGHRRRVRRPRQRREASSARAQLRQAEGGVRTALAILSRTMGLDPADRVQINARSARVHLDRRGSRSRGRPRAP